MKLSERYPVGIYAVREKTTLLVPTVGIKCASHEARKLPWPPQAEELGALVLKLMDELKQNRIQYDPEAKGYWFQPGIRSWKAFQAASSSVDVELRGTELSITRWDAAPNGALSRSWSPVQCSRRASVRKNWGRPFWPR